MLVCHLGPQLKCLLDAPDSLSLQEMLEQEKKHLSKMCELIPENRARPTMLLPVWNMAGFFLGV